jgi:hypothetical protein
MPGLPLTRDDLHVEHGDEHRELCTVELIAEGHAECCPGENCPFWQRGCVLTRVEEELDARPELAALLLELRRELDAGHEVAADPVRSQLEHLLFH